MHSSWHRGRCDRSGDGCIQTASHQCNADNLCCVPVRWVQTQAPSFEQSFTQGQFATPTKGLTRLSPGRYTPPVSRHNEPPRHKNNTSTGCTQKRTPPRPTHRAGAARQVPSSSGTMAVHDRSWSLLPLSPPRCNIKKTHLHDVRQGRVTRLVEPEVRGYHRREPQGHHLSPRVGLSLHLQLPAPVRHRDLPWPPARPAEPLPPTEIESKTRLSLCAPR